METNDVEFAGRPLNLGRLTSQASVEMGAARTAALLGAPGRPSAPVSAAMAHSYDVALSTAARTEKVHEAVRVARFAKTPGDMVRLNPVHWT